MSTIAAIATPNAPGGISIIRISGDNAITIAEKVFRPVNSVIVSEMKGYTCCFGKIFAGDIELDEGILTVFHAPKSYTGENVAEISCHGGLFVTKQVLRAVFTAGAEPADPGEFTKRAFLNEKISLTQAEAVMDIISAQGSQAHKSAIALHDGALFGKIRTIIDKILSNLGKLAAWVDYPDEDIPYIENSELSNSLEEIRTDLSELAKTYDNGKIYREGIETVIVGKPNVGKSTLMNYLTGTDKSIVTEFPGTTRDIIEEIVQVGDVILRLSDTAGLRQTSDVVEGFGVKRAYQKLALAELVLAVFDNSKVLQHDDFLIIEKLCENNSNVIAIINKDDTENLIDEEFILENFPSCVRISAKRKEGLESLQAAIESKFLNGKSDFSAGMIANERQKKCIDQCYNAITEAKVALDSGETLDAVSVVIDEGVNYLLELTGEKATQAVVDEVFSHFCVGK